MYGRCIEGITQNYFTTYKADKEFLRVRLSDVMY